jgi:hypothetical protein
MSAAVRDHINAMTKKARDIAMQAMLQPKSEREYLLACGKVQQLLADARELKEAFLEPAQPDPERDLLPDDSDYPEAAPAARRVRPQPDRLATHRQNHRPRQV